MRAESAYVIERLDHSRGGNVQYTIACNNLGAVSMRSPSTRPRCFFLQVKFSKQKSSTKRKDDMTDASWSMWRRLKSVTRLREGNLGHNICVHTTTDGVFWIKDFLIAACFWYILQLLEIFSLRHDPESSHVHVIFLFDLTFLTDSSERHFYTDTLVLSMEFCLPSLYYHLNHWKKNSWWENVLLYY